MSFLFVRSMVLPTLKGLSVAMATALHYSRPNSIWKFPWLFRSSAPTGNSHSLQDEGP